MLLDNYISVFLQRSKTRPGIEQGRTLTAKLQRLVLIYKQQATYICTETPKWQSQVKMLKFMWGDTLPHHHLHFHDCVLRM